MSTKTAEPSLDIILPIATKVHGRADDLERAVLGLFPSLCAFGYPAIVGVVYVICPDNDKAALDAQLKERFPQFTYRIVTDGEVAVEAGFTTEAFSDVPGWFRQQIGKLAVASRAEAEVVLILDSDVVATRAIEGRDIVIGALPYQRMGPSRFRGWFEASAAALGVDLALIDSNGIEAAMGVTPEFLSRAVVTDMLADLRHRAGPHGWGPYLMRFFRDYDHTWTEFSLYWLRYLVRGHERVRHVAHDVYRFIEHPDDLNPATLFAGEVMFAVLQATKLNLEQCRAVYDRIAAIRANVKSGGTSNAARTPSRRGVLWLIPGAHKTGSTMVQRVFERNTAEMNHLGFRCVDRDEFYQSNLRKYLSQGTYYATGSITAEQAEESLLELTRTSADIPDCIVFIENIFGEALYGIWTPARPTPMLYPGFRDGLQKLVPIIRRHYDLRCMYFIRRQDQFLESLYLQCIFNGFDVSDKQFVELLIGCDLSWQPLLDSLRQAAPGATLPVVPFELLWSDKRRYLERVLAALEISADLAQWQLDVFENPSLSDVGVSIAQAAFPHLQQKERGELISYLQSRFNSRQGNRYVMLSPTVRSALVQRFAEENIQILNAAGIDDPEVHRYYAEA